MRRFSTVVTSLSALVAVIPFVRPRLAAVSALLWPWKLLAGALAPVVGILGAVSAAVGVVCRDWTLTAAGSLGAAAASRFMRSIPDSEAAFAAAFCADQSQAVPRSLTPCPVPYPGSVLSEPPARATWRRDLVYGYNRLDGTALRADLWEPVPGAPRSGLGVIHVHGGGWHIGDKDLGTRSLFRRLAGHGHVVLDIAYTLWPRADIPGMVSEVNQAVLWLKDHAVAFGLDRELIALMGGSAGGHLALLAAYAPEHPAFAPSDRAEDARVCGVIAFYPPVDLLGLCSEHLAHFRALDEEPALRWVQRAADAWLTALFNFQIRDPRCRTRFRDLVPAIIGGEVDEIPEVYRLVSPCTHVGPHCPPTLLLQGSDDLFQLAPGVRRMHQKLQRVGVPAVLVELPHTDHAFDLVLPSISPVARAGVADLERFLTILVARSAAGLQRPG